jgi:hypothetical protein
MAAITDAKPGRHAQSRPGPPTIGLLRPRVSWRRRVLLVDGGQVARRGGDVLVAE